MLAGLKGEMRTTIRKQSLERMPDLSLNCSVEGPGVAVTDEHG
jgi:hypothetical protein